MHKHLNITVSGKVQGVFYRVFTRDEAQKLNLCGFVRNEPNGDVYMEVEGEEEILKKLIERCKIGPPRSSVKEVNFTEDEIKNFNSFEIYR